LAAWMKAFLIIPVRSFVMFRVLLMILHVSLLFQGSDYPRWHDRCVRAAGP
jgi:hypothetical protein